MDKITTFIRFNWLNIIHTKNPANEVTNPSFVNSQAPPNSSSSICWKLVKYAYNITALSTKNLNNKQVTYNYYDTIKKVYKLIVLILTILIQIDLLVVIDPIIDQQWVQ